MKPRDVKRFSDILKMKRDNWHYGNFGIGFNGANELYIYDQKLGEKPKQSFIIPKHVFNYFAKVFSQESVK